MVSYDLSAGVDDNCNAGEMEARVLAHFGRDRFFYVFSALSLVLSAASAGFSIPFSTRHGPFLGTLFFAIGWRLSSHRGAFTCKPAIALLSGGFAILVIDLLFVPINLVSWLCSLSWTQHPGLAAYYWRWQDHLLELTPSCHH